MKWLSEVQYYCFHFWHWKTNVCNARIKESLSWILAPVKTSLQKMPSCCFFFKSISLSLFLLLSLSLPSFFLAFYHFSMIRIYVSMLIYVTHPQLLSLSTQIFTHVPAVSLFYLPPSQLVSPDSPLLLHLPSSLARSCCHWSVLASPAFLIRQSSFGYRTGVEFRLGLARLWREVPPPFINPHAPLLPAWLAYVDPSRLRAVGQMRITKYKCFKMTAASNKSCRELVRCKGKTSMSKFVHWLCFCVFVSLLKSTLLYVF